MNEPKEVHIIPNYPEIIGCLFLSTNNIKKCVFYILNIPLLFIPLFIIHVVPDLQQHLFDEVEDIQEAEFVFLVYKKKERELLEVKTNHFLVIPF